MLKYLIFLIIGIIFFILYNSKDTFSVGAQNILGENERGCDPENKDYVDGNECDGSDRAGLACFNNVCINPCRNTNVNKICANDLCNGLENPITFEEGMENGVCLAKKCQSFNTIGEDGRRQQQPTNNANVISYRESFTNRYINIPVKFNDEGQIDPDASRANMSKCGEFSTGPSAGCGPAESPEEKCNDFSLDCVDGECLNRGREEEECRNIDRAHRCYTDIGTMSAENTVLNTGATLNSYAGWSIVTANPAGSGVVASNTAADPTVMTVTWDAPITTTDATTYTLTNTDPNLSCQMLNNSREYCIRRGNYHERCRAPGGDEPSCNPGLKCIPVPPTYHRPTFTEWCAEGGLEGDPCVEDPNHNPQTQAALTSSIPNWEGNYGCRLPSLTCENDGEGNRKCFRTGNEEERCRGDPWADQYAAEKGFTGDGQCNVDVDPDLNCEINYDRGQVCMRMGNHLARCKPVDTPEEKCNNFSLDCVDNVCLERGREGERCRIQGRTPRCVDQDGNADPDLQCDTQDGVERCIRSGNLHERCKPVSNPEEKCNDFSLDCVNGVCLERGAKNGQCRNIDRANRCVDQDDNADPDLNCETSHDGVERCIKRGNYQERCRASEPRCNQNYKCSPFPRSQRSNDPTFTEQCLDSGNPGDECIEGRSRLGGILGCLHNTSSCEDDGEGGRKCFRTGMLGARCRGPPWSASWGQCNIRDAEIDRDTGERIGRGLECRPHPDEPRWETCRHPTWGIIPAVRSAFSCASGAVTLARG